MYSFKLTLLDTFGRFNAYMFVMQVSRQEKAISVSIFGKGFFLKTFNAEYYVSLSNVCFTMRVYRIDRNINIII